MADFDATFVEQVLDVSKRQREPHVHHDREADDLGRRLEVLEGVLSDECEPVSVETMTLHFMPHRVDATQRERRRGLA